ncbi:hypothetical protein BDV12DRAFT_167578 [Aspergillus spectabilis]
MPIFMVMQAVDAMEDAKESSKDIKEAEEQALIMTIISVILFFDPLIGYPLTVATNAARLSRMISLAGLAGEAGLAMVDIVNDPSAAPLIIMEMLFDSRLRTARQYREAADTRQQMTSESLGKLGEVFRRNDDVLQDIIKSCSR